MAIRLLLILILFSSCNSLKNYPQDIKGVSKIELDNYKIYTFKLRQLIETTDREPKPLKFNNGVDTNNGLVWEMLYILRDSISDKVIYFTTKSHKYIEKGRVFNSSIYEKYLVVNDLDFIYIGKELGNRFSFNFPKGRSHAKEINFFFTEKGNVIKIDSVTNNYAKEESREFKSNVIINDDVFGMDIKFQKENKEYAFALPFNVNKRDGSFDICKYMYIDRKDVYFEMEKDNKPWFHGYSDCVKGENPLQNKNINN